MPLIYNTRSSYKTVLSNIRLFNGATPVGMGMNLGRARYQGKEDFIGCIREGKAMGCGGILSYNYGMATEEMLEWMKEAYES